MPRKAHTFTSSTLGIFDEDSVPDKIAAPNPSVDRFVGSGDTEREAFENAVDQMEAAGYPLLDLTKVLARDSSGFDANEDDLIEVCENEARERIDYDGAHDTEDTYEERVFELGREMFQCRNYQHYVLLTVGHSE
ncbi:MAG: hypothetical protein H0X04_00290 [Chthoniobacterales bacterium]|nr:hypothetical protein [Chthoniobacterales bacterium]